MKRILTTITFTYHIAATSLPGHKQSPVVVSTIDQERHKGRHVLLVIDKQGYIQINALSISSIAFAKDMMLSDRNCEVPTPIPNRTYQILLEISFY